LRNIGADDLGAGIQSELMEQLGNVSPESRSAQGVGHFDQNVVCGQKS
jgi:hypothetical protein